jgi:hypothetical protein
MTGDTPDRITVVRVHLADERPGRASFMLCRGSLAARLAADAEGSGDEVTDLGPGALLLTQSADRKRHEYGPGTVVTVGVADGSRWLAWLPPAPVEPVPGTPGARAARN